MMDPQPVIGRCPSCTVAISREHLLFETEFEAGSEPVSYAECPSCGDVVNPYPC